MELDDLFNRRPQGPLFHYTSATGLIGILGSGNIWASSAYHLNDSKEFRYALALIAERVQFRIKHENGLLNAAYGKVLDDLSEISTDLQAFVVSFSEQGDLLSQWLAYGGKSNGYAIGLDPKRFQTAREHDFVLVPCIYKRDEQETLADAVINVLCKNDESGENFNHLMNALLAAAAIKHPGFQQEAEWRLIKISGVGALQLRGIKFREGRNGLVPYIEAPLTEPGERLSPDFIHIGPNEDIKAALTAMQTFLGANGLLDWFRKERVIVVPSATPYRP